MARISSDEIIGYIGFNATISLFFNVILLMMIGSLFMSFNAGGNIDTSQLSLVPQGKAMQILFGFLFVLLFICIFLNIIYYSFSFNSKLSDSKRKDTGGRIFLIVMNLFIAIIFIITLIYTKYPAKLITMFKDGANSASNSIAANAARNAASNASNTLNNASATASNAASNAATTASNAASSAATTVGNLFKKTPPPQNPETTAQISNLQKQVDELIKNQAAPVETSAPVVETSAPVVETPPVQSGSSIFKNYSNIPRLNPNKFLPRNSN